MVDKIQELFVEGTDSRNSVIVTFGGRGNGFAGVPPYEFVKTLNKTLPEIDQYYYIDGHQCWYHKGIIGISNNIPQSVEYLKSKFSKYKNVYFIGCSAGGYAAILFGSLCNVTKVIAFKPQTHLNDPSTYTRGQYTFYKEKDERYMDIKQYMNKKTKYMIYCGSGEDGNHHCNMCHRVENSGQVEIFVKSGILDLKAMRDSGELGNLFVKEFLGNLK